MFLPVGEPFKVILASCTNVSARFSNAECNADLNPPMITSEEKRGKWPHSHHMLLLRLQNCMPHSITLKYELNICIKTQKSFISGPGAGCWGLWCTALGCSHPSTATPPVSRSAFVYHTPWVHGQGYFSSGCYQMTFIFYVLSWVEINDSC